VFIQLFFVPLYTFCWICTKPHKLKVQDACTIKILVLNLGSNYHMKTADNNLKIQRTSLTSWNRPRWDKRHDLSLEQTTVCSRDKSCRLSQGHRKDTKNMRLTTHCFLSSTNFHHVTADCIYISHDVDDDDESFIVMTPGNYNLARNCVIWRTCICVKSNPCGHRVLSVGERKNTSVWLKLQEWIITEDIAKVDFAGVDNDGVVDSKFKP